MIMMILFGALSAGTITYLLFRSHRHAFRAVNPVGLKTGRFICLKTLYGEKNFKGPPTGSWGMLPKKILKIKCLRMAIIAFPA